MPTGYTADLGNGKVTEFREFAMQCARAFGACIELRDDPDAPIPDEFKASDYHTKALVKAKADLKAAEAMTASEAVQGLAAHQSFQANERQRLLFESAETRQRYDAMLAKVQAWQPPTPEHQGMKDFMVKQIEESIKWDCNDEEFAARCYPQFNGHAATWRQSRIEAAKRDIEYHTQHQAEDEQRAQERTEWVRALRGSI